MKHWNMTTRDLNGEKSNYSVPPKTLQVLPSLYCSLHHLRRRPPSSGVRTPQLQHDKGALTFVHIKRANGFHCCWTDGLSYVSHKVKLKVEVRLSLCIDLRFRRPCIVIYSYKKPTRCTNFSNLFLE